MCVLPSRVRHPPELAGSPGGLSEPGDLASSVTSTLLATHTLLLSLDGRQDYWLGGTDSALEGGWVWVTGDTFGFTHWHTGQPNAASAKQDYIKARAGTGKWDGVGPNGKKAFACQMSVTRPG